MYVDKKHPMMVQIISLVPRPSHSHANIYTRLFLIAHQKAGRSGQFGDVKMMSPGRGLEECLEYNRLLPCQDFEHCLASFGP